MGKNALVRAAFAGIHDAYHTHRPVLCEAVLRVADGIILELGAGDGSTPALHEISKMGRTVVTLESDANWLARYAHLRSDNHHLVHISSWSELDATFQTDIGDLRALKYAVAFVDHAPHARRAVDIAWLAQCARVVVAHDTEDPAYGYDKIIDLFRYKATYRDHPTWTDVFSNFVDVSEWSFR